MTNINEETTSWMGKTIDTDAFVKQIIYSEFLNKSYDTDTFFKNLLERLLTKPIWVKQAIYMELRDDIKKISNLELLETLDKSDLLQLYIPIRSEFGEKVLADNEYIQSLNLSRDILIFLKRINGIKNVIDICYESSWTLKYVSQLIIQAEELGLIVEIRSKQILNLFNYIADNIDLGSLLIRMNKLTVEQLTTANCLISKESKTQNDENNCLEAILINLGYITGAEINNLMLLKKASEMLFTDEPQRPSEEIEILHENISIMSEAIKNFRPLLEAKNRKIKQIEAELKLYKQEMEKLQQNKQSFKQVIHSSNKTKQKIDNVIPIDQSLYLVSINGLYGYIDKTGKMVIDPQFEWAVEFSENLAAVRINGKYGFIDKSGKIVIQPKFDFVRSFSDGYAAVEIDGRIKNIDKTGEYVNLEEM